MNIFHVNNRRGVLRFPKVGEWVTERDCVQPVVFPTASIICSERYETNIELCHPSKCCFHGERGLLYHLGFFRASWGVFLWFARSCSIFCNYAISSIIYNRFIYNNAPLHHSTSLKWWLYTNATIFFSDINVLYVLMNTEFAHFHIPLA